MLLTIGPGGCGFSFLNWSIMYLRGDVFYQTLDGNSHAVPSNPLLNSTAHNYEKDHLRIEDSKNQFDHATENSIIYAVPGSQLNFEYLLSLPGKKIIFDTTDCSQQLMARAMICVPKSNKNPYHMLTEQFSKTYDPAVVKEVLLDCHKLFMQYYHLPGNSSDYYRVNYNSIFNNLDKEMPAIFDYLGICLVSNRWQHWKSIYDQYQHSNHRNFYNEVVAVPSKNIALKSQIFKQVLQWRNTHV